MQLRCQSVLRPVLLEVMGNEWFSGAPVIESVGLISEMVQGIGNRVPSWNSRCELIGARLAQKRTRTVVDSITGGGGGRVP